MLLVVGLGNPGAEYEGTRHNIGFAVADAVAARCRIRFAPGGGEYLIGGHRSGLLIMKPLTYMNNSGEAVADATIRYGLNAGDMLVVLDDFQIPLGSLRLRISGSSGGHNGLSSIIAALGSDVVPRLRCGIGSPVMPAVKSMMSRFVLSPFEPPERPEAEAMIGRARDAAIAAAEEGIPAAMNRYNRTV